MPGTVFETFAETAGAAADHPFLIVPARADRDWHPSGVEYSYGAGAGRGGAAARPLRRRGLRPRPPRLDPAGEPAGVLLPLPGAERAGRLHRADQSRLPARRDRLSARAQRGGAGRGAAASRGRRGEGGAERAKPLPVVECARDAGRAAAAVRTGAQAQVRPTSRANARCSTRPARRAGRRVACCRTSTR